MVEVIVAVIGCFSAVLVEQIRSSRRLSKIEEQMAKLDKYNGLNYMNGLRLTVVSEEMPFDERIIAGRAYIDHGGNGEIKKIYTELVRTGGAIHGTK